MAKGKKCPVCGYYCYAETEDDQKMGTWVVYVCLSKTCPQYLKSNGYPWKEKVFEAK
jgi:hypothetical protein